MRICPKCNTRYTDETLKFCLQDGTPLVESSAYESASPTVEFSNEEETIAARKGSGKITFDLQEGEGAGQETSAYSTLAASADRRPSTILTVVLTAVSVIVVIGILGGIAAVIYYGGFGSDSASSDGSNSNSGISLPPVDSDETNNGRQEGPATPSPSTSPESDKRLEATPTPTPNPTATPYEGDVKGEVSSRLYEWRALAQQRELGAYMSYYADKLDYYYSKRNVSKSTVRADKRNAFAKYPYIRISISNLVVSPSGDGSGATAAFDKEWTFRNSEKTSTGKVRSQFLFRRSGDKWVIAGERDTKVYYVR